MKRIILVMLAVVAVVALLFGTIPAMAAKPDGSNDSPNVIEKSNGFPSGPHFNLNIHGKKSNFVCEAPPPGECGNSVFIPEYTPAGKDAKILYVSNKKSSLNTLAFHSTVT